MGRGGIPNKKIVLKVYDVNFYQIVLIIFNSNSKCINFNNIKSLVIKIPISSLLTFEIIGSSLFKITACDQSS
jgi:hypothetical protein